MNNDKPRVGWLGEEVPEPEFRYDAGWIVCLLGLLLFVVGLWVLR